MRTFIFSSILFSLSAFAEGQMSCVTKTPSIDSSITLTLSEELQQITWWDHTQDRFQIAKYKGTESTQSSSEYGYLLFVSEDDAVDGGEWIYKLAPELKKDGHLPVIEIYRFEGKEEERTEFLCY